MVKHILYFIIPLSAFLFIWIPVVCHYHVPSVNITDDVISRSRHIPDDPVLDEILGFFQYHVPDYNKKFIGHAEQMIHGEFKIPGCSSTTFKLPFNHKDFRRGGVTCKQKIASFWIPRVLVTAYELTKREEYLMTARDVVLDWAKYERTVWVPKGVIWRDYPISYRISVLSRFWKLYRNHQSFDASLARAVFELISRSGQLLAKPSHYIYTTNHGFMQNLALMQISLAFPELPRADYYKQLALERMHEQMSYYISDEGVVLEHSAGYHAAGIEFISMAFRYLTLLDEPIPEEWLINYHKAKDFYAHLRRPDKSLPVFGDTRLKRQTFGPLVLNVDGNKKGGILHYQEKWTPNRSNSMYPVAGYSIWWNGLDDWPDEQKINQTVVIWSNFSKAHKHADEMGVLLWAGDENWWTNIGYWPYGTRGRSEAVSWRGSNAPHMAGESTYSERNTELKFHGWSDNLSAIDLERKGPGEYTARRQVVHIKPGLWIVIDHTYGEKNARTETVWTTASNIKLTEGKFRDSYYLKSDNFSYLKAFFINSGDATIRQYRGSMTPFAGWEDKDKPASAVVIEQSANNSWSAAIWSLENSPEEAMQFTGPPYMKKWIGPEDWKIELPLQTGLFGIWRDGDRIYVNEDSESDFKKELRLIKSPDEIRSKSAEIRVAHEYFANKYHKFKGLSYRWKATYFLIMILILQEIFFLIYRKIQWKHYTGLRVFSTFGWVCMIVWLSLFYLSA